MLKHISKMTRAQMDQMSHECELAAMNFAKKNNFSGLSQNGWFNFYAAIQEAIRDEWLRAKEGRRGK